MQLLMARTLIIALQLINRPLLTLLQRRHLYALQRQPQCQRQYLYALQRQRQYLYALQRQYLHARHRLGGLFSLALQRVLPWMRRPLSGEVWRERCPPPVPCCAPSLLPVPPRFTRQSQHQYAHQRPATVQCQSSQCQTISESQRMLPMRFLTASESLRCF